MDSTHRWSWATASRTRPGPLAAGLSAAAAAPERQPGQDGAGVVEPELSELHDLVIVGAGPAGAACALRARQQRPEQSVLLLDAAEFPRDKTCGDGIAAHVLHELTELGVPWSTWDTYPDVARLRLRTPSGRSVSRVCREPNRVIRRLEFDAVLVAAALDRGAMLRRHRVRSIEVRADRVVLDGSIHARVVVGADGANGVIRRALGAPAMDMAVAIRGYAPTAVDPSTLVIEFAESRVPAYAWSFPLADGGANVGYGVIDKRAGGTKAQLLAGLASTLPGCSPEPGTVRGHQLPLSTSPRFHPDGLVLLVGDAAGLVNPLTGEGIYYAIVSGSLAADAAGYGAGAGARHRGALARRLSRHHWHVARMAALVQHRAFLDAAVAASARHQSVFDAAVDLGLGAGTAPWGALARVAASYVRGRR